MRKSWNISRRSMLKGMGAMLALPKLEIMAMAEEAAAVATKGAARVSASSSLGAPLRFISIFQPNGVYPKAWDVIGEGTDYEFSPILKPLESMRDDLLVVSGLNNTAGGGHVGMTSAFLSGHAVRNGRSETSLDQKIAQQIGGDTAFESLVLGTEPPRQGRAGQPISMANTVSWSSPTTRISPEINPRVAFDRLFRDNSGPEAKRNAELKKSVVDIVLEDAKSLKRKASNLDQHKIDEYLDSVRSVETQLDRTILPPERSWIPPTQPGEADFIRPQSGIPRNRAEHLRLMMDIMILSLWTDTTRVSTLMTAHGFSRQNFSFIEGVTGDHHGISHHKEQQKSVDQYTTVSTWYIDQFKYFLERMKSIDEGGSSLLDNSIVLYGSGMKDGNGHKKNNLPILIAGKGKGAIKPGRHINVGKQPLADLHLTLAQKFGIEDEHFNKVGSMTIQGLG